MLGMYGEPPRGMAHDLPNKLFMIKIDEKTFKSAFEKADAKTKNLMGYSKVHSCLTTSLPPTTEPTEINSFVALIGYRVLSIIDDNQTINELGLQKVTDPKEVLVKVLDCINKNNHELVINKPSLNGLSSEIAEAEADLTKIAPIRTMADDMTKSQVSGEKVYTSTQEAILREGWSTPKQTPPPSNPPPIPPVSTSNWG